MNKEQLAERLHVLCRKLRLSQSLAERAYSGASEDNLAFLVNLFEEEVQIRKLNRVDRYIAKANFPSIKSLEDFVFENVEIPPALGGIDDLESLEFINRKENLLLYGPIGTGKTHLACALGLLTCQQDRQVRFFTVSELIYKMHNLRRERSLEVFMKEISKLDLLILDEWGYVAIDREGSQLLFQVIAACYEKRSLIITTNIEFSKWASIFTDTQMAAAMIDRIIHHGHLILFQGSSYRMEHALMKL